MTSLAKHLGSLVAFALAAPSPGVMSAYSVSLARSALTDLEFEDNPISSRIEAGSSAVVEVEGDKIYFSAFAFQLPFKVPFFQTKVPAANEEELSPPRIAIIGAGAGGSSAAFWISKAKERFGIDVEVDVYERNPYIGGRSVVVHPYNDTNIAPLELGGSIFVDVNKNLMRAAKEFNLSLFNVDEDHDTAQAGIWDGQKFLVTMDSRSFLQNIWTTIKLLWRYGFISPKRAQTTVENMVKAHLSLYTTQSPRWDNVADLAAILGWTPVLNQTASEYFDSLGVGRKYSREIMESMTRVNYGQNLDAIHGHGGATSMATSGASGVIDGNYQIFENFLEYSRANVYLDTTVYEVDHKSADSPLWTVRTTQGTKTYKGVILAAPYHFSGIVLPSSLDELIPRQPYVHLHVTLLSTRSPTPNSVYFNLPPGAQAPTAVLTTYEGVREGGAEPEFNSLTYHGPVACASGISNCSLPSEPEHTVKIFSDHRISDAWLANMFEHIGWILRKEWDSYPILTPTDDFPPVKLAQGFYYVNSFEPMVSTMETETISSRNVVDLLLHEEFGYGICGSRLSASEEEKADVTPDDFVLGWDC